MSDVRTRMRALNMRRNEITARLIPAARAVVPVLLDAGRSNSAKELQEILFQLDALDQEMLGFTQENLEAILDILKRSGNEPARDVAWPDNTMLRDFEVLVFSNSCAQPIVLRPSGGFRFIAAGAIRRASA